MNAKHKILVAAGLLVVVVLVGVPGWLLYRGIARFSTADQDLGRSLDILRSLYARDPFPSRENILLERDNADLLNDWVTKLHATLREGQIRETPITPAKFSTTYTRLRNALKGEAAKRGIVIKDDTLGFERYALGKLPPPRTAPRLEQQVKIVTRLCLILMEARVKEISLVSREDVEDAAAPAGGGADEPPALFEKRHFTLAFKAKERAVLRTLNRLADDRMFVVVTRIALEKQGSGVRMPAREDERQEEKRTPRATGLERLRSMGMQPRGRPGAASPEGPEAPEEDGLPSKQERMVSGPDLEIPMDVTLDLDVYIFNERQQEA